MAVTAASKSHLCMGDSTTPPSFGAQSGSYFELMSDEIH